MFVRFSCALIVGCCLTLVPTSAADSWPEWRGGSGQGTTNAANLPVKWGEDQNVAWKVPIRGLGWSTPVIADGLVWVTTATDVAAPADEAAERRKTSDSSMPLTISESVSLFAVCLDLQSGKVVAEIELATRSNPQMIHADNSYATPTPIIDGNRLYCHFGPNGLICLNTQTEQVEWTNNTMQVRHENGVGSTPILWNDLLIVHCDGIDLQYIVAINKHTGEQVWKSVRSGALHDDPQLRKSYATPLIVNVEGAPQVISAAADWVYGYDPTDGRELWRLSYGELGFSNSARPVAAHGLVYICTGYMQSRLLAIRPGIPGLREPKLEWTFTKQVPAVSSPLLVGNELYMASDKGIASCLDAKTGELIWKERIGKNYWASPILADNRLHFFGRDSITTVIEPGREFRELAQNQLSGEQLASGAAVDGSLLVRTAEALYCLRLPE